eukprot:6327038-Alexandrium_andersonii.AAC.1
MSRCDSVERTMGCCDARRLGFRQPRRWAKLPGIPCPCRLDPLAMAGGRAGRLWALPHAPLQSRV